MSAPTSDLPMDSYELASRWCVRLVEGSLSDPDRQEFEAWLAEPANMEIFERVAEDWDLIEVLSVTPELMSLRKGAMATAQRAHHARWMSLPQRHRGAATAIAASILLALGMGGVWFAQRPVVYQTGVGERQVIRLADGSSVSLDGDTEVRVKFAGNRRLLWLDRGRARFNVAKDLLRPFSVDAAGRVVVATGTSFSVERMSGQVRVVLYEGRVSVLDERASRQASRGRASTLDRTLAVNEELVVADRTPINSAPAARIDPVRSSTWEGGILSFDEEPLAIAAERMNRYSDQRLEVDPSVAKVRVSGVFKAGDTAAFVDGVTTVFPVDARPAPDSIKLSAASSG